MAPRMRHTAPCPQRDTWHHANDATHGTTPTMRHMATRQTARYTATPNDAIHGNAPNEDATYGNAPNEDVTAPYEGPRNHTPAMAATTAQKEQRKLLFLRGA
ncbi:hypothetical protein BS47DRAFT_1369594 [Hydnum rufescens UP504]|uniref:Uncharacterized protein n=1 Tax=Hydnum rufescens UP504 TaxID=1448309 RepID=A0A9P6AD20_9AGAM|nr:hypothetical protein BS47DRAFT_1369594 [Hydnum rufescens UP504]